MNEHVLKIHPKPFHDLQSGAKTGEVRNCADRDFKVGDGVLLMMIDETGNPTGIEMQRQITHIQTGYGLPDDICVLSYGQYTAVDMTTAAAQGFRDGVDSFKIRGEVLMEIFHDGGPEPFICAIHGCICLEQVEAAQKDFRENMPDELEQGEGIYNFSFYYEKGQYDEYGRCEIAPGWGFDFVSYKAFEAEEVQA